MLILLVSGAVCALIAVAGYLLTWKANDPFFDEFPLLRMSFLLDNVDDAPRKMNQRYSQMQMRVGYERLDRGEKEVAAQHFANGLVVYSIARTGLRLLELRVPDDVLKAVLYKLLRGEPKVVRLALRMLRRKGWPLNPEVQHNEE